MYDTLRAHLTAALAEAVTRNGNLTSAVIEALGKASEATLAEARLAHIEGWEYIPGYRRAVGPWMPDAPIRSDPDIAGSP